MSTMISQRTMPNRLEAILDSLANPNRDIVLDGELDAALIISTDHLRDYIFDQGRLDGEALGGRSDAAQIDS